MPFGLPTSSLKQIRSVFARHPEVETTILYGSRAKGNFKPGSDIDLTFKGTGLDLTVLNRVDNELDDLLLPWSFDLSIYSQITSPDLIEHIDRAGVIFYQQEEI